MAGLTMSSLGYVEPMRKNWFIVQFDSINGNTTDKESLSIACKECGVPKLTTKENEIHRINDIVYTPGKSSYDAIDFTFNEYIQDSSADTSVSTNKSAGKILYDWQNSIHNALTGVQGAKKNTATTAAIVQIDGNGNIVRAWTLYNAWPTSVEYDGLGSDAGDILTVKATLRFDWAELTEYSINVKDGQINTAS